MFGCRSWSFSTQFLWPWHQAPIQLNALTSMANSTLSITLENALIVIVPIRTSFLFISHFLLLCKISNIWFFLLGNENVFTYQFTAINWDGSFTMLNFDFIVKCHFHTKCLGSSTVTVTIVDCLHSIQYK